MKKAISVDKKRGRPATGKRPAISARVSEESFAGVEAWARQRKISHSEAIRQLVELGLKAKAK
jgi:Ribbon-helix-helix protein, copG family